MWVGRPSDWSVVDLPGDPVPGDSTVIRSLALSWSLLADDAEWAKNRVSSLLADGAVMGWIGKAGDAFRAHSSDLPGQLDKACRSYRSASTALSTWSSDLDGCQASADKGLALAQQAAADVAAAQRVLDTARANETSAQNASKALLDTSSKYAHTAPPPNVQLPDPSQVAAAAQRATAANNAVTTAQHTVLDAQARLAAAKKMITDAAHLRDDRGNAAAKAIRDAANEGIPPDSFWDKVGDALSDVWHGLVEIAKIVVLVGGIIAMIIGGPIAWIVFAAALIVLADTLSKYAQGKASLLDVGLALLACIPMTKGLTTLAELSNAFKAGGMLGAGAHLLGSAKTMLVDMVQGIRALSGGLKTIITDFRDTASLRGAFGDAGFLRITGGELRLPKGDLDFELRWADEAYDAIRATNDIDDVARTSLNEGFSTEDIVTIKNHLFMDSHTLDRYGEVTVAPFDANPRIAEAWTRLSDGTPHPADFDLLRHELHEAKLMQNGAGYSAAHQATLDAGYVWDSNAAVQDGFGYQGGR
jgi:hypothetical protein